MLHPSNVKHLINVAICRYVLQAFDSTVLSTHPVSIIDARRLGCTANRHKMGWMYCHLHLPWLCGICKGYSIRLLDYIILYPYMHFMKCKMSAWYILLIIMHSTRHKNEQFLYLFIATMIILYSRRHTILHCQNLASCLCRSIFQQICAHWVKHPLSFFPYTSRGSLITVHLLPLQLLVA